MKLFSIIIVGLMMSPFSGWLTDLNKAKAEAVEKHRFILLNFSGSDWCVPCIKLKKEIFETGQFKSFAESNLVLLNADFPRTSKNKLSEEQLVQNERLADEYNPAGKFPLTLLLTADGKILKAWEGINDLTAAALIQQIKTVCHDDK